MILAIIIIVLCGIVFSAGLYMTFLSVFDLKALEEHRVAYAIGGLAATVFSVIGLFIGIGML